MKFLLATIGIFAAGMMGYVLEPSMRYSLTGQIPAAKPAPKPELPTDTAATPDPVAEVKSPTFDYSNLQPEQLPDRVVLKAQAFATVVGESDTLPLPAGNKVKPIRIEGDFIHFSVAGTAQGKISIDQTDLVEQLIANPPAPVSAPPAVVAPVEPAPVEPAPVVPTPVPAPEPPQVNPAEVVAQPQPQPMPDPPPAPAPTTSSLSPDDIVKLMQDSIRSGQIKEFTADQVIGWKAADAEQVDGESYQVGLVAYKAETIFGVKTIQAKAMIQQGKVVRWIWPTSGLEIE
jgi:hypothetical protein